MILKKKLSKEQLEIILTLRRGGFVKWFEDWKWSLFDFRTKKIKYVRTFALMCLEEKGLIKLKIKRKAKQKLYYLTELGEIIKLI